MSFWQCTEYFFCKTQIRLKTTRVDSTLQSRGANRPRWWRGDVASDWRLTQATQDRFAKPWIHSYRPSLVLETGSFLSKQ